MDNNIYEDNIYLDEADNLDDKYEDLVNKLVTDLNYGKIKGSNKKALASVSLLEQVIIMSQDASAMELISRVRAIGRRLEARAPHHIVPANMVRRVLKLIRDEHTQSLGAEGGDSLQRRVRGGRRNTLPHAAACLSPTLQHIAELRAEIEASDEAIAELLAPLIASNSGTWMGPPVTIRAEAVLPAGDTLAPPGSTALAAHANTHNQPVIVLSPLYKLSPSHSSALSHLSAPSCPSHTMPYRYVCEGAEVVQPGSSLVPANLITFFITNLGASSPSYVYRLLTELYDTRDYLL